MMGEWIALPLIERRGASNWRCLSEQFLYPVASRSLSVSAVLRIEANPRERIRTYESRAKRGLPVYFRLEEVTGF